MLKKYKYFNRRRILIVPFFVLAFYLPGFYGDLTALILFIIASFTDFLDGMLLDPGEG